ncbi:hypothetical protein [Halomonas urumqiensis]|uniref:Uncharacterized protein n=1 Tax=Halomonas urumqiensis TaxID=1684789 RepID=A0A2N7UGL3_9GAMM|nr:hypothetical protein [Halomonas urumqiensis]PMR79608.1 hypothetical protein C1H70_11535 [Halomonas urumqiensis]PTB01058.1 hypothetical protein C6V82_17245 [Halomonas urumqiensis]GHE22867.1 hypothetical protein GCM10017767_33880 [Halomonas urumqiensis]
MRTRYLLPILLAAAVLSGCASNAISPSYTSSNPDIMRISENRPGNPEKRIENLGSYCVEITETWNDHGTTPDGQTLWAKDSARAVVRCE